MNAQDNVSCAFRLCFRSLGQPRSPFVFPCDHFGRVDLDDLSDRARNNYLYARAMVGRELMAPAVVAAAAATT
jgi:hypothetical protein